MIRGLQARRGRGGDPKDQRGIALILALIMVVMMTAFATEFTYDAAIKNFSAYHYRDDTRAYYLAKGGVRTYGLLLVFGRQVSGNSMITGMLSQIGINIDGAAMVCRSIPFLDTAMLRFMMGTGTSLDDEEAEELGGLLGFGGGGEGKDGAAAPTHGQIDETAEDDPKLRRGILDFDGDYKVTCQDESSKIDINGFGNRKWIAADIQLHPTAQMLYGLMAPVEYDPLFEERLKMDRWELIGNIKDWVDVDQQRSGLWGGDEDALYDDYDPRYRAKNAPFDTVEEARLVAGVTDEVWETFGENLSVHTKNYKVNVNSASADMIVALLRAFTDPSVMSYEFLVEATMMLMIERATMPGPFTNAKNFMQRVEGRGVVFANANARSTLQGLVTTKSRVFKLSATGYVNDSTSTVEATVRVNRSSIKMLEWRER